MTFNIMFQQEGQDKNQALPKAKCHGLGPQILDSDHSFVNEKEGGSHIYSKRHGVTLKNLHVH